MKTGPLNGGFCGHCVVLAGRFHRAGSGTRRSLYPAFGAFLSRRVGDVSAVQSRDLMKSPAARPPLRKMGAFGSESGVIAMAWVDPGGVVKTAEDFFFHVGHEAVKVGRVRGL